MPRLQVFRGEDGWNGWVNKLSYKKQLFTDIHRFRVSPSCYTRTNSGRHYASYGALTQALPGASWQRFLAAASWAPLGRVVRAHDGGRATSFTRIAGDSCSPPGSTEGRIQSSWRVSPWSSSSPTTASTPATAMSTVVSTALAVTLTAVAATETAAPATVTTAHPCSPKANRKAEMSGPTPSRRAQGGAEVQSS